MSYLKSAPSNCLISKFWEKNKMPKFGITKCLLIMGIFVLEFENNIFFNKFLLTQNFQKNKNAKIWYHICLILVLLGWNLKIILSYLKSPPTNLYHFKILWKKKNWYIWNQKCLMWVFSWENFENLLSYFKSAPSNLSKVSF